MLSIAQLADSLFPEALTTWIDSQGVFGNLINLSIVGLFIFGWMRFLRRLRLTSKAFIAAERKLDGTRAAPTTAPFPAHPAHLNALWSNFLRARAGTTVRVGGEEISTVSPEDTFTEEAVLEGYNRSLAVTLAGVFTGLGILGTFIGLVSGMSGLQTDDPTQISAGASQLIDGMSAAFYTSIFGIVFSLAWLFLDRIFTHDVQRHVGRFFLKAKDLYPVESADRLLHRLLAVEQEESAAIQRTNTILQGHAPLGEKHPGIPQLYAVAFAQRNVLESAAGTLEEQKAILQALGTDMAVAFQNAMDNSLDKALRPVLETIAQTMTTYSAQVGERQADSLREMVTYFQDRLSEQLGGQFEGLANTLQATSEWQARVHGELEHLLERIQQASTAQAQVLERSSAACELFAGSLGQLGEMHQRMEKTSQQLEAGTRGVMSQMQGIAANVERVAAELDACVNAVSAQADALGARIQGLDAQQDTYRQANEAIRTQLAKQLDALNEQVDGLTTFWLRYKDDLSQVGEQLRGSMAEFGTFTAEKLGEVFSRFDAEMATVVEHLSGTLAEIREVTEDLPGGVERLRESLSTSAGAITAVGTSVQELSRELRTLQELPAAVRTLAPLPESVTNASARVKSTEDAIGRLDERLIQFIGILEQPARHTNGGGEKIAVVSGIVGDDRQ